MFLGHKIKRNIFSSLSVDHLFHRRIIICDIIRDHSAALRYTGFIYSVVINQKIAYATSKEESFPLLL